MYEIRLSIDGMLKSRIRQNEPTVIGKTKGWDIGFWAFLCESWSYLAYLLHTDESVFFVEGSQQVSRQFKVFWKDSLKQDKYIRKWCKMRDSRQLRWRRKNKFVACKLDKNLINRLFHAFLHTDHILGI